MHGGRANPTARILALPGREWGAGNLIQMVPAVGGHVRTRCSEARDAVQVPAALPGPCPLPPASTGGGAHTCPTVLCRQQREVAGPPLSKHLPGTACQEEPIPQLWRGLRWHLLAPLPGRARPHGVAGIAPSSLASDTPVWHFLITLRAAVLLHAFATALSAVEKKLFCRLGSGWWESRVSGNALPRPSRQCGPGCRAVLRTPAPPQQRVVPKGRHCTP